MIRTLLVTSLLTLSALPASAVPLLGDFECLSNYGGPDTYHGTLRVEEPTEFGFLNEGAAIEQWYPLNISNPNAVIFDQAFAEQISAGATMISARIVEDEFTYSATIRTKKGDEVVVTCVYVY